MSRQGGAARLTDAAPSSGVERRQARDGRKPRGAAAVPDKLFG